MQAVRAAFLVRSKTVMYEIMIGMLFAAGSIGSYLLAAKVVGEGRCAVRQLQRRISVSCSRRPQRALTAEELSKRFNSR